MPSIPVTWRATQTVNVVTAGAQTRPRIAQLSGGNIVVTWQTSDAGGTAFVIRLFDPAGNAIGGELLRDLVTPDDNYTLPDLAANANDGVAIVYAQPLEGRIFALGYANGGFGSVPALESSGTGQPDFINPAVAYSVNNNQFLYVYEQLSATGSTIVGKIGSGPRVTLLDFPGGVTDPEVATTFTGNFAIVGTHLQAGDSRIVARVISPTGTDIAAPFEVAGTGGNGRADSEASVAARIGGGLIIAWRSSTGTDSNIEFRIISQTGADNLPPPPPISVGANDAFRQPVVIPLLDGTFIIAYDDDLFMVQRGAHFDQSGALLGSFVYGGNGGEADGVLLSDGRFATVWSDATTGEISLQILDTRDSANTTGYVLAGTTGNDSINFFGGRVYAAQGDDIVSTGIGSSENYYADGGDGIDTIDLGASTLDIDFDMATGTVILAPNIPASAKLVNFENAILGSGYDIIDGTAGNNRIDLSRGGDDYAYGGLGDDAFILGATLTGLDIINGGGGNDQVGITGNYTGANRLVLAASTLREVELLAALPGGSYDIVLHNSTVAAGATFTVFGGNLGIGESFTVSGAAELDGNIITYGGLGIDTVTGGSGADGFYFGPGKYGASDRVRGGAGTNDQLALDGDFTLTLTGREDVEVLALLRGPVGTPNTFNITVADTWTLAGQLKTIFGTTVTTNIVANGSAESDGLLRFFGGSGNDTLTGGAGNDFFFGNLGADTLTGGGGADTFLYNEANESTGSGWDRLVGLTNGIDKIDLPGSISGVATTVASGTLSTASFNADLTAAVGAGQMGAGKAVLFTPTSGTLAGNVFLIADANGIAGYQADQDFVFQLPTPPPVVTPDLFI